MEGGRHDSATGRENGRAIRKGKLMTEMDNVRTGNKSASGTGIKNDMGWGWASYGRGRQRMRE